MPNTSHSSIFDFWKDKCITQNGSVEIEIGYEGYNPNKANIENSITVINDWGEPECWACGLGVPLDMISDYDTYIQNNDLNKIWNDKATRHFLQRAHIVPDKLNGKDKPSNLFLLCSDCHRESPDTIYSKQFFKWVYKKRISKKNKYIESMLDAAQECAESNIPIDCYAESVDNSDNNYGIKINSHGGSYSKSSYTAMIVGEAEKIFNQRLKDGIYNQLSLLFYQSAMKNYAHKIQEQRLKGYK